MAPSYHVGEIEIRPDERRVLRQGETVALGARAFDLLLCLIERRDRVVPKQELMDLVWRGAVVEESNLTVHISALRKLLGPEALATVPGRGYRFTAAVTATGAEARSEPAQAGAANAAELPLPSAPSIAVLPFDNLGADPAQESFVDGITEDVITELSRFRALFVIARNSSFSYKGRAVDVRAVARELGVRYVVEGSIRRAANRIRVTAQLIDARSGAQMWAEKYDRALEDLFALQEELTRSIVAAVAPQIEAAEFQKLRGARSGNLTAYELAMRARDTGRWADRGAEAATHDDALRLAEQAVAIDPTVAPPSEPSPTCAGASCGPAPATRPPSRSRPGSLPPGERSRSTPVTTLRTCGKGCWSCARARSAPASRTCAAPTSSTPTMH